MTIGSSGMSADGLVVAALEEASMCAAAGKHSPAASIVEKDNATQRLFIPGHFPSLNEIIEAAKGAGGRGFRYAAMKSQWGETVWAYAKSARLKPVRRATFRFLWIEKDKRRDKDNVAAFKKAIFDGLVKAKVLPGDGWAHVVGWTDEFTVDPKRHGVEITILEAP